MSWHRTDHGEVPEEGQEITMCVFYSGDATFQRWRRMRVDVMVGDPPRIYGPGLPCDTLEDDWPERPEIINGRVYFWKPFEP